MLAAFLLLAAEVAGAAEEAEPSKAPFYVAGGLFAVFVLMVAAMATAVITS